MSARSIFLALIMMLAPTLASAGVRRVWVVNDGEKIERDATNHPASARNSAWDGRIARVFGARNEIVAFQVIVEADAQRRRRARRSVSTRSSLGATASSTAHRRPIRPITPIVRFKSSPSTTWTSRHLRMHRGCTIRDGPAAPPDPTRMETGAAGAGERPRGPRRPADRVQPEARIRRSGSRSTSTALDKPGVYKGNHRDSCRSASRRSVPIELEVFDFTLPDENSMHAMLYYSSDQPELYHGRNLDAAYHRLAHRHRVEFVQAYDERTLAAVWDRFSGEGLHARARLRRAWRRKGQRARSREPSTARVAISTNARPPGRRATRG